MGTPEGKVLDGAVTYMKIYFIDYHNNYMPLFEILIPVY